MRLARFFFSPLFWARCSVCVFLALVAVDASALDLNQASQAELQEIKGIGPKTAARILEERQRGGPFESMQDLSDRVKGIGAKRITQLQASGLQVGEALPVTASKSPEKNTKNSPK